MASNVPDDDELEKAIKRLSNRDDKGNVLLNRKEAEEVRDALVILRKARLIKAFLGYFAAVVAGYLAFKADLMAFFGGGK